METPGLNGSASGPRTSPRTATPHLAFVLLPAAEAMAGALIVGLSPLGPGPWLAALAAGLTAISAGWFGLTAAPVLPPGELSRTQTSDAAARPAAVLLGRQYVGGAVVLAAALWWLWDRPVYLPLAFCSLLLAELGRALAPRHAWGLRGLLFSAGRGAALFLGMSLSPLELTPYLPALLPPMLCGAGFSLLRSSRSPGAPALTAYLASVHMLGGLSLLGYQSLTSFAYSLDGLLLLGLAFLLTLPGLAKFFVDDRPAAAVQAVQYCLLALLVLQISQAAGYAGLVPASPLLLALVLLYQALRARPVGLYDPRDQ